MKNDTSILFWFVFLLEIQIIGTNRRRRSEPANENGPVIARANTALTATDLFQFQKELIFLIFTTS